MKILLLGATGLVGRNVLAQALAHPANVASVNSAFFYSRIKGEVERDVKLIGFGSLTIVRPSLIDGEREEHRLGESIALRLMSTLAPILPKRFHVNPAHKIAAVSLDAVLMNGQGIHVCESKSMAED